MVFDYFTIINLIFILFSRYIYKYINLLLTTIVVSIIGSIFFWLCPKEFNLKINKNISIVFNGDLLKTIDILFHQIPLIYILYNYYNYYKKDPFNMSFFNSLLILIIYLSISNLDNLYGINSCNQLILMPLSISLAFLIYCILILI
jgi:hypothetical protein